MTERSTRHGSFVIEHDYPVSPQRLFAAWADPETKRAWFAEGEGWEVRSFELDFREGGSEKSRFRFKKGVETFGEETWFGNETLFNEIVANERIVFTYAMDRNGVRFSVSLATVEFKQAAGGARLILSEDAAFFEGADGVEMREAGWRELLGKLEQHLAGANAES
jgi:uncharacterized protein YndB with AHSA1/START domain